MLRRNAKNIVDTRWVIKWKLVDGNKIIKVRITMRGFKDTCMNLETFAGTATRWSQRIVNSAAATEEDFELFSFDVSKAFAKGMTFEELARLSGEPLRHVQFELAPEDVLLLKKLPGFENFDPATEVLDMVKPIYGLKDAPRAWRKKLHEVLTKFGMRPSKSDPQVYMSHYPWNDDNEPGKIRSGSLVSREGADGPTNFGSRRQLKIILTTHVDDLKGAGKRKDAMALLQHLKKEVGDCSEEWNHFTHTGIEHDQNADGVTAHQTKYAQQLVPMVLDKCRNLEAEDLVDSVHHGVYMSLLGGTAWLILTRVDLAVFVQALQRRAHAPRLCDCKRLNVVVRYAKRRPLGIFYGKLDQRKPSLTTLSDAAFKALVEESSGLALRGCCILLADTAPGQIASSSGKCHLIEYQCKRQRRVVRSTFSAELNGLIDSIETAMLIQYMMFEVWYGCDHKPDDMARWQEEGLLQPDVLAATDARAVFDAVAAADICEPAECSLKLHLLALRDKLANKVVKGLFWTDTRDMLADGLTKGSVDRAALRRVAESGRFAPKHPTARTKDSVQKVTETSNRNATEDTRLESARCGKITFFSSLVDSNRKTVSTAASSTSLRERGAERRSRSATRSASVVLRERAAGAENRLSSCGPPVGPRISRKGPWVSHAPEVVLGGKGSCSKMEC
jgi:hypothetical protein